MPGVEVDSRFRVALLASLVVHVVVLAMSPSNVVRFERNSVLPLVIKLVHREANVVAEPPKPPVTSVETPPVPGVTYTKLTTPSARAEPLNSIAPPAAAPVDLEDARPPATPEAAVDHPVPTPTPPVPAIYVADNGDSANARILTGYGERLSEVLSRHQHYPRLARLRGWQGQVHLRLHLARQGALLNVEITKSSGHEVLDQQALEIVKRASPLPLPPEGLRADKFTVDVPVTFRLEQS